MASTSILGQLDKAVVEAQEAIKINPEAAITYATWSLYVLVNRLGEARATARRRKPKLISRASLNACTRVGFLAARSAGMAREAALVMGKPGWKTRCFSTSPRAPLMLVNSPRREELTRRAVDSADREGQKRGGCGYQAEAAVREALVGNLAEAKQWAERALVARMARSYALAAIALARSGEVRRPVGWPVTWRTASPKTPSCSSTICP